MNEGKSNSTQPRPKPIITTTTIINDFFDSSTIHAVRTGKEIKRSGKPINIAFWLIVLIGCFAGVTYEIYQIITEYKDQALITQVSWTAQSSYKYPPMAFCPKRWLSWKRARRLQLSEHAMAYLSSLVNLDVIIDETFDEDDTRQEVLSSMKRFNISNFIDLLKLISYEPGEILRVVSSPTNVTFRPMIQNFGICYSIDVEPIPASILRTSVLLRLAYKERDEYGLVKYDGKWQPRLLLRDSNGLKANFISFSKKAIYIIDIEAQIHTRMSRSDKICLTEKQIPSRFTKAGRKEEYRAALCSFLCIELERFRRSCDYCQNIAVTAALKLHQTGTTMEPCFYYKDKSNADHIDDLNETVLPEDSIMPDRRIELIPTESPDCSKDALGLVETTCSASCPPPCTQWQYKHSTSILSEDLGTGEVLLWIAYNPIDGVLLYEEIPTFTLDTLISNIGGQLGLWLGASIISLVQIIYYILVALCNRKGGDKEKTWIGHM